jgi:hypothetical protein
MDLDKQGLTLIVSIHPHGILDLHQVTATGLKETQA